MVKTFFNTLLPRPLVRPALYFMNHILLIIDHADQTDLVEFAHRFAYQNGRGLTVAIARQRSAAVKLPVLAQAIHSDQSSQLDLDNIPGQEDAISTRFRTIDITGLNECELANLTRREGFSMVMCSMQHISFKLQSLLDQLSCPLMILPEIMPTTDIRRVAYLNDLRYCQQQIVTYLSKLDTLSLMLAHTCLPGLPDLSPAYAEDLFKVVANQHTAYGQLFFSHIKEKDALKITDTLIAALGTDMLALQNRKEYFKQLLGDRLAARLPANIGVPLLVFPS